MPVWARGTDTGGSPSGRRGASPRPTSGWPADIARAAPAPVHRGDLLADLPALAATAPRDATLVVFHSAVLAYVSAEVRAAFAELVGGLPGHWISNEAAGVLPGVITDVPPPDGAAPFLLALDGRPLAWTAPHGQALRWL
ncbi:DUF2332 family protein [Micromonospora globispora]|uniref:DUF2332 family protein n=1 Tax=Micromonospora globispora TaxID=1450148 RepID=UPI0024346579|nr:DUF2332 family protein [Micromonospora globispora]